MREREEGSRKNHSMCCSETRHAQIRQEAAKEQLLTDGSNDPRGKKKRNGNGETENEKSGKTQKRDK